MSWSPLGRPVRVGIFEYGTDAINCFRKMPRKPCMKPGSEVEIVSMVMKLLDWQWEVIDTEKEFGVVDDLGRRLPDGNFSGIMGLLSQDKIDMSGLSLRITPARMAFAHFTFPIRYFQQVYIIKRPPEYDFRNFVFAPFTTDTWLLLLATIMAVSTMRFACALYWDRRVGSKFSMYTNSFLETFGLMLRQRVQDPTVVSTMILEGFLIVVMMSVSQYYQTTMNSRLTAPPSSRIPFYHQEQLIDLLLHKKTFLTYYYNYTLEGTTVKNEKNIKRAMMINPVVVRTTQEGLLADINKGAVFYSPYDIEFLPQPVSVWSKEQGLTVIRDTAGIYSYQAFGFSHSNRKLCQMFNKALIKILPGIPSITLAPGYEIKMQPEDVTVQVKKTRLSLTKHLVQVFYIFLIGCGISLTCFAAETVFYRFKVMQRQRVYQVNRQESDDTPECTFTPLPY
uniref:Ionotropic glutamate receptor C-terminal domain-containing protein n=1 Tax=Caenorhabditis japonica TaxID=281687 RepID=A0A8R1DT38_CAEJA